MLLELAIRNIALIEALTIEFAPGFNVLTGETGAGKSIVVDSVNLVLGGRADRELIRTGAEKATVTALFDVSGNAAVEKVAEELGIEIEDGLLTVTREISRSGRNICRLSGIPVPLSSLRSMTRLLTDVHGQHEHQLLIDPARHMEYLDAHADREERTLAEEVASLYASRSQTASRLKKLMKKAEETRQLSESLRVRIEDISALHLKPGEAEKLEKKLDVLENAEKIRGSLERAYHLTYAGDAAPGAQEQLLLAADAMAGLSELSSQYADMEKRLRDIYFLAEDAGRELQKMLDGVTGDPALAARITDRLENIYRLEKRYGETAESLLASCEEAERRMAELESDEGEIACLKKEYRQKDGLLREASSRLTVARKTLAKRLEQEVMNHLSELGMAKTVFQIDIRELQKPTPGGLDDVEFMISPNPGEPLKPLGAVASGGELSRVMLALKAVSADGGVDSMVFDEIDTGVSGRIAQAVGEKLRYIARDRQVLCVTHLAQIASLGNTHFLVEKTTENGRTGSHVRKLEPDERITEVARLLDGGESGETGRKLAEEMLLRGAARS